MSTKPMLPNLVLVTEEKHTLLLSNDFQIASHMLSLVSITSQSSAFRAGQIVPFGIGLLRSTSCTLCEES